MKPVNILLLTATVTASLISPAALEDDYPEENNDNFTDEAEVGAPSTTTSKPKLGASSSSATLSSISSTTTSASASPKLASSPNKATISATAQGTGQGTVQGTVLGTVAGAVQGTVQGNAQAIQTKVSNPVGAPTNQTGVTGTGGLLAKEQTTADATKHVNNVVFSFFCLATLAAFHNF